MTELVYTDAAGAIDPSYATTIIPLIAVPLISLVTTDRAEGKDAFFARLAPAVLRD